MSVSNLEAEAKTHFAKAKQTVEFLMKKLEDSTVDQRRKDFIIRDIAAYQFLLEYAKEALSQRGIEV
jgi:hypothetical protein